MRIAILGAGWAGRVHARAYAEVPGCEVVVIWSRDEARAQAIVADAAPAARVERSCEAAAAAPDVDLVSVCLPNAMHEPFACTALAAGKDVVCEKPLAHSRAAGARMVAAARAASRRLYYAEECLFAPRYARVVALVGAGAVGEPFFARQEEKHKGPYADWFFRLEHAGGGALADMGCHGIALLGRVMGGRPVVRVFADLRTYVHGARTSLEDHALVHLVFEGGGTALSESAWTQKGGMESRLEVHGRDGLVAADLAKGYGVTLVSDREVEGRAPGLSRPAVAWAFENGYPQELAHFVAAHRAGAPGESTGEDGLAVLEVMEAAYRSAGLGRPVELPLEPASEDRPLADHWLRP